MMSNPGRMHVRLSIAVIVIVVAAIGIWSFRSDSKHERKPIATTSDSVQGVKSPGNASGVVAHAGTRPIAALVSTARPDLAPDNPYVHELNADNPAEAFRRLIALKNPTATRTAHDLAMSCANYVGSLLSNHLKGIESGNQKPDVKAKQLAMIERRRAVCGDFTPENFQKDTELWIALGANPGDPRGATINMPIMPGPLEPDRLAAVREAAQLKDPVVLNELGGFFIRRTDMPRDTTYDIGDGTRVSARALRDAFMIAACDFGDRCGPDSAFVAVRCVTEGKCDATGTEDYLLRYNFPPAEADKLIAARQMVVTGVRTGIWPPNFWAPGPVASRNAVKK